MQNIVVQSTFYVCSGVDGPRIVYYAEYMYNILHPDLLTYVKRNGSETDQVIYNK